MSGPSPAQALKNREPQVGSTALRSLDLVAELQGVPRRALAQDADHAPEPSGAALLALAERSGFRGRLLPVGPEELRRLDLRHPAILRQADGRCRVLASAEGPARGPSPVLVVDPARPADPPARLDGLAAAIPSGAELLLLRPATEAAAGPLHRSWRDLVGQAVTTLPGFGRDLLFCAAALAGLSLAGVLIVAALLDNGARGDSRITIAVLCGALALVAGFEAAFAAVRDRLVRGAATAIGLGREAALLSRLVDERAPRGRGLPAGQVASRFNRAASLRAWAATPPLATAAEGLATVLVFGPAMMWCSPRLGLIAGAMAALGLLALVPLQMRHRRAAARLAEAEAARSGVLVRSLAAADTVRRWGLDARQRRGWDEATALVARLRLAEAKAARPLALGGRGLAHALVLIPFGLGAAWAMPPNATVPEPALLAFLLMSWRVATPLRRFGALAETATAARMALEEAAKFEQADTARAGRHGAIPALGGRIEVSDLDFSYPEAPAPALRAVSFAMPAGGTLGILGRSGAGKTTLARLLAQIETGHAGLIKIDGIDIRDIEPGHLRGAAMVVDGEAALMPGPLGEVLRVAAPEAGADRLAEALRLAGADQIVARLPEGLDTPVQEGGAPFSDGERQRLLVAQALVADPRILVLDDAFSALDPVGESRLAQALPAMAAGRTLILITPRLSLLRRMDAILVLDRGEVQDIGSHRELVARSDLYSGLWARQHAAALPRPDAAAPALQRPDA